MRFFCPASQPRDARQPGRASAAVARRPGILHGGVPIASAVVVIATALLACPALPVLAGEVVLVRPPRDLVVCQVAYGATGAVEVSWTGSEEYTEVEILVDDELAASADGAARLARIAELSPGDHEFAVRGVTGETASSAVRASFRVLETSPLPEPVLDLGCALIPELGGTLELSWSIGPSAWDQGLIERAGRALTRVESGVLGISIVSFGHEVPSDITARFKNLDGYWSEPIAVSCVPVLPELRRGDCDGDASVTISDSILALRHLFLGGRRWYCDDACDTNDDGAIDVTDAIALLRHLFAGAAPPPAPGPERCGPDLTPDFLGGVCRCASGAL